MKYAEHLSWCHFFNSADVVWPSLTSGPLKKRKLLVECNQGVIFNKDSWRQILSFCFHAFAICSFMPCQKFQGSDVLRKLFVWRSLWDQLLMNINGFEKIISGRDNSRTGWSMHTTNSTLPVNCSYRNNLSGNIVLWFLKIIKCTYKMLKDMPWKSVFSVLSL